MLCLWKLLVLPVPLEEGAPNSALDRQSVRSVCQSATWKDRQSESRLRMTFPARLLARMDPVPACEREPS